VSGGSGMEVVREKRRYTNFSVVDNEIIENNNITCRARLILIYLLTRPDNWRTNAERLATQMPEGRDAIRTAFKELEKHGYIEYRKSQGKDGRWSTKMFVFDMPKDRHGGMPPQPEPTPPTDSDPEPQESPETDIQGPVTPETDSQGPVDPPETGFQDSVNQDSVSQGLLTITENHYLETITEKEAAGAAPNSLGGGGGGTQVVKSPAPETTSTSRLNYPEHLVRGGYWPTGDVYDKTIGSRQYANVTTSINNYREFLKDHPNTDRRWQDRRWVRWFGEDEQKAELAYMAQLDSNRAKQYSNTTGQAKQAKPQWYDVG
jgi:hypothetical protein